MAITSRRRDFLALGSVVIAWPLASFGQVSVKRRLIAWQSSLTQTASSPYIDSFLQGMRDLHYVEGRDFEMVYRFAEGYQNRIPAIAEEVVRLGPDVIVATAVDSAVALKKITSSVPIVSGALADAVHLGLIASEARPGGNVTGIAPYVAGLPAKQMEFARDILPGVGKVGLLTNIGDPKAPPQVQELTAAAKALGINVVSQDANRPEDLEGALQALQKEHVDLVIVLQTSMLLNGSRLIADSLLSKRLPSIYGYPAHVSAGGLMSYGVNLLWCFHRVAYYVDKILRGDRPADLPVEFPNQLMLVINLKTAKALGITVPPLLLARADEVIE